MRSLAKTDRIAAIARFMAFRGADAACRARRFGVAHLPFGPNSKIRPPRLRRRLGRNRRRPAVGMRDAGPDPGRRRARGARARREAGGPLSPTRFADRLRKHFLRPKLVVIANALCKSLPALDAESRMTDPAIGRRGRMGLRNVGNPSPGGTAAEPHFHDYLLKAPLNGSAGDRHADKCGKRGQSGPRRPTSGRVVRMGTSWKSSRVHRSEADESDPPRRGKTRMNPQRPDSTRILTSARYSCFTFMAALRKDRIDAPWF